MKNWAKRFRSSVVLISFFSFSQWISGCATTLPEAHHDAFKYPESGVYLDLPTGEFAGREYEPLGWVKARSHYVTMEEDPNNSLLCKNYYNKAARTLLKDAIKAKADAVIQVRSVVMTMDGKIEEFKTPECSDDGAEGEILLRGIAIRFKPYDPDAAARKARKPETANVDPAFSSLGASALNLPAKSALPAGSAKQPMVLEAPAPTPPPRSSPAPAAH
jgi:hypothetical protein